MAAVKVLEALGFRVSLVRGRKCCGRPAFSQGNLEAAAQLGRHNLDLIKSTKPALPILFLEPSCYSMFLEDYRELKVPDTEPIAARSFLFEQFVNDLLERESDALCFPYKSADIATHAHCHAKSIVRTGFMKTLVERLPGRKATLLETGCGMAGALVRLNRSIRFPSKWHNLWSIKSTHNRGTQSLLPQEPVADIRSSTSLRSGRNTWPKYWRKHCPSALP